MTYQKRLPLLIFVDSLIVVTAFIISIFLLHHYIELILFFATLAILLICYHTFSFTYKLYKKAWEYASIGEVQMIIKTAVISIMITGVMQLALFQQLHFRLLFITCLLQIALIGGSRLSWRMMRDKILNQKRTKKNALIVGAGAAGTMIARQLKNNSESGLDPVAFIDDDIKKQKLDIFNIPVIGGTQQIKSAAQMYNADMIIIAIPSLKRKELNNIYLECAKTKVKTQILPMIEDLVTGKVSVNQFREVEVEDLLGRDPVELEFEAISESITNKVVLVTGAGGSIGSEICRQISEFKPKTLILLGHGENSIYSIEMELRETFGFNSMKLVTEIADIQDYEKIMTVFNDHKPHVVYHAAAHKHVPLMERNPEEALKNNVIGTMNVAKAASLNDVETFVMVSSDKAVNPTSVMGATKRLAEMVIQYMDTGSKTKFTVVRFGNVLGSRGSVIPLFKKQIQKGGPITITHPEMVRYFMTIPEASKLVIQAGSLAKGGEIFVLDMGEPVKILDLAKNLIKLSGHSVEEIGIQYTGMRRGEKLYEELLNANEIHDQQIYPKIYIGKSSSILIEEITELIASYSLFNKSALSKRIVQLANKGITENEKNGAVLSV
ncbi:nucleoside-diphosphate sugar epimerase/dehydratase [Evansella halocellulosilytica]|uniref:nucleoside-diphosphate sugar epimerase/dehydratase n=1 Tax=Evansella halocellulosilytica TaxID=2011013 RepID=UPI000BB68BDE|nr:nucleoside-diphosphate sugar epimerase/dehydratase [Evansella halocellulosilytica]